MISRLRPPTLDRPQADPRARRAELVERAENVVLLGPPGVGKTHLAIALGVKVVEAGHTVCFLTLENLMRRLVQARHENRLDRILPQLAYPRVLTVDELGYLPLGPLPAPTGVSVTATTEDEQD